MSDHSKQAQQSLSERGEVLELIPESTQLFNQKPKGGIPVLTDTEPLDTRELYRNHPKIRIQKSFFGEGIFPILSWEYLRKIFTLVEAQIDGGVGTLLVDGYPNVFDVPAEGKQGNKNQIFTILAIYCQRETAGWWRIDGWRAEEIGKFQVIRPSDQRLCSRRILLDI